MFVCVCVCSCVHSDISTTRQVHGKLLAPTTDKTTSGTGMAGIDGGRNTEERRGRREKLSVAGGRREKEGERGRRVKLNSRRAGVGERMNECVVDLLCPAPEWSVSKLSSNW